jgi:hypothetical protein
MKQVMNLVVAVIAMMGTVSAQGNANISSIPIGSSAPEAARIMTDVSGVEVSLMSARKENGLLVIFSCNTCPFVLGWEDRYIPIGEWCAANKVGYVLVNSNEAQRNNQDAIEKMREHAAEKRYNTFYVVDSDHVLADAFGATRTPEVFLFDADLSLVYKGAIDDNMEDAEGVEKPYLMSALQNMVSGKNIDPSMTKSVGCTIKRIKK